MFDYFYGQSGEMFSYFRVPKILFRDIKFKDLSTDAKTLYGILLDRMGLSVKNGWLHSTMHPRPCSFITRTKPIMIYRTGGDENVEKSNHDCHRQSERRNRQNHDLRKSGRGACTGRQAVRTMCEFIIISCGDTAINALAAADTTLIPVQAQYLSAKGLEQLLQTIQKVRRQINPKLKIEGILMTMTDSRTNYGREIDALIRQVYGSKIRVFEQSIPHSVCAAEISAGGRSIFAQDRKDH